MYIGLHVKYPLYLSDFNENWTFSASFREVIKYLISLQSVQLEPSCAIRTDGQHDKANSRFSQFCECT